MARPAVPVPVPAPRFWSLDALRGACAAVVFLSHWHLWSNFAPHGTVENGVHATLAWLNDAFTVLAWPTGANHPAVICFFVLSGFCIHYPFARRTTAPDWAEHYRRRFWRIMPVYWTAALLGLALVSAEALQPSGSALLALHTFAPVGHVIARLLGLYGIFPREILAGNYPLNTVAVELAIYAAYPWIYFQAARGRWAGLGLACLGLQAAGLVLLRWVTPFWVFNSVFMLGIFWAAGAWAAHRFVTRGTRSFARELLLAWLGFLLLKALPSFYGLNLLKGNLWGVVCTLGVLQCLHLERRSAAPPWASLRALRFVGQISYSLYAVHAPVLMLVTWILLRGGGAPYSVQLALGFAAAVGTTLAVHFGIERVFYQPRARTPSPGVLPATAAPVDAHSQRRA